MVKGVLFVMETAVPSLVLLGRSNADKFEACMAKLELEGSSDAISLKCRYAVEVDGCDSAIELIRAKFSRLRVPISDLYVLDIALLVEYLSKLEGRRVFPVPPDAATEAARQSGPGQKKTRSSGAATNCSATKDVTPSAPIRARTSEASVSATKSNIGKPEAGARTTRGKVSAESSSVASCQSDRPRIIGLPKPSKSMNLRSMRGRVVSPFEFDEGLRRHGCPKDGEGRTDYGKLENGNTLRAGKRYVKYVKTLQWGAIYGCDTVRERALRSLDFVQADIDAKFEGAIRLKPNRRCCAEAPRYGKAHAERLGQEYIEAMLEERNIEAMLEAREARAQRAAAIAATEDSSPFRYEVRTPDGKVIGKYTGYELEFLFQDKPRFKGEEPEKWWQVGYEDIQPIVEGPGYREVQAKDGTFAAWNDELLAKWENIKKGLP